MLDDSEVKYILHELNYNREVFENLSKTAKTEKEKNYYNGKKDAYINAHALVNSFLLKKLKGCSCQAPSKKSTSRKTAARKPARK